MYKMATPTICPHFLRGRCRFGDRCKFEHTRNPPAFGGYPGQQREVCSYFLNGRCKYGDRCRFEHPSTTGQSRAYGGYGRSQRYQGEPQPWSSYRQSQSSNASYNVFNSYNRRTVDAFGPGKQSDLFGSRENDIRFQTPLSGQSRNESYSHDYRSPSMIKRQVRFNESGPQIRLYNKQGNVYEDFLQVDDRDSLPKGPKFQSNFGRITPGGRNLDAGFGAKTAAYTQSHTPEEIRDIIQEDMRNWGRMGIWPLSSYSYAWKTSSLPGLKDYSPEELRWEAYEAQRQGNVEGYKQQVATLLREAQKWREKYAVISLTDTKQLLTILQFGSKESPDVQSGPTFQTPPPGGQLSPVDLFSSLRDTSPPAPLQQPIAQSTPGIASLQKRETAGTVLDKGPTSSLSDDDLSKKYGISVEDILAFKAQGFVLGKIPICPPPPELC